MIKFEPYKIVCWAAGILSFIALAAASLYILGKLHVPTYIHYNESYFDSDDNEITGTSTSAGYVALIISFMLAIRIGMAIYEKSWRGGITEREDITFKAWLYGLCWYALGGYFLDLIFGYKDGWHQIIAKIFDAAIIGFIFLHFFTWRRRKLEIYDSKHQEEKT